MYGASGNTRDSDALDKLMKQTNALHVDDDFASAFQKSDYAKFCPKNLIKKMSMTERDSTICSRDMRFLVKYYLHMTSEKRLTLTSEGYEEAQKLMEKYNVEKKTRSDNITLHRIAASFPIIGVNIMRKYNIERKFSTAMLEEKNAGNFPWCMRTQMCLSLAPFELSRDPDYRTTVYAIIVFMYYENKIVSAMKKAVSPTAIFEKVLNIAHTVYIDSPVDPMTKRDAWNHVAYDYNVGKRSVLNLLKYFRAEIPEAEATVMNRFEFIDANENMVFKKPRDRAPRRPRNDRTA